MVLLLLSCSRDEGTYSRRDSRLLAQEGLAVKATCMLARDKTFKGFGRAGGLLLKPWSLLLFFAPGLVAIGQNSAASALPRDQTIQSSQTRPSSTAKQSTSELKQQLDVDSEALAKIPCHSAYSARPTPCALSADRPVYGQNRSSTTVEVRCHIYISESVRDDYAGRCPAQPTERTT